ncbi:eukaryotic translation initiation factor 4E-binding protein 3-like [Puntigrus tetrazona]|uniref:eukaryotic translation initiation factor 4E-binding protein 3-like n=1 Tax=Puntigrus tetrazona TaxID=1606681 RepID=UPI001C89B999|nr:eukaryotic translation initiation factor 4E-binding protein 3-like [Puntigrus tetrazona]
MPFRGAFLSSVFEFGNIWLGPKKIVPCSVECKYVLIGRCNACPIPPPGTRIIYDRKFLLDCRNSPIARTPPCCLPQIPGVTIPSHHPMSKLQELKEELEEEKDLTADDNQFEMDI